jgi:Allene oxide cyclase barrel like domain
MRRRRAMVATSAVLVSLVTAGVALADLVGSAKDPIRLDVISRATAINDFVDLGDAGPDAGDLYVFSDDIFLANDPGTRVGQSDGRCTMINPATARFGCTLVTSLPDGDITTEGTLTLVPGTTSTGAVTGGTRRFRNARGEATLDLGPLGGPHQATFTLIVSP